MPMFGNVRCESSVNIESASYFLRCPNAYDVAAVFLALATNTGLLCVLGCYVRVLGCYV